ncbi:TetR family transcriptional regulator [Microbacterium sp. A84]|uniref:TetR/AcrR family transcriptional regulator n=1 Tax=Microbacterium sp. A84 TaxID=3450715 RepID=UPI003F442343
MRTGQAAETRLRILDAAARQFAVAGYAGTSLADIAQAAGVSIETVKLSGPKRQLLLAAFEHSFAGSEGIDSLAAHEPVSQITADTDNTRYLAGIVHFVAESNRRSSLLWSALLSAAASDTILGTELAALQRRRHTDMLILVDELCSRRLAFVATSREQLADAVSFLLSPEGYNQLVLGACWSQVDYEAWLVRSVVLLADDASATMQPDRSHESR